MLAAMTLAKVALPVAAVLVLAASSSSKKPAAGPQDMSGMLLVAPNQVVVVNPAMAAWVMQGLAQQSATPIPGSAINQATLSQQAAPNAPNALAWAQGQAAQGKIVLLGIEGNNSLAAVIPGQEVTLANVNQRRWAVLLEPPGASLPLPGGGSVPNLPGPNYGPPSQPGGGTPAGPGYQTPPGDQGTNYVPGQQPGPFDPLGQLGKILKPYLPPQQGQPSSPGQPQSQGPTAPAGYTPGQGGGPGTLNIPGLGTWNVPNLPGQTPAPGGDGPPLPSSTDPNQPPPPGTIPIPGLGNIPNPFPGLQIPGLPPPGGTIPPSSNGAGVRPPGATVWLGTDGRYRYAIRSGDIASRMAQWFTGNFARWRELEQVNPVLKLVMQNGAPYGYTPWRLDQVLVLPPGWDGSKGAQTQTVAGGVGVAVGAY